MNPEIATNKIQLKIVEKSDAESLFKLRTDPQVSQFVIRDLNKTLADIEEFIDRKINNQDEILFSTIKTVPENELAGTICLWRIDWEKKYAEVGYELFPSFQGKGIMSDALKAILSLAFDQLEFEYLEAFTNKENLSSRKLLEKFGFEFLVNKKDENNINNVIYGLKSINRLK